MGFTFFWSLIGMIVGLYVLGRWSNGIWEAVKERSITLKVFVRIMLGVALVSCITIFYGIKVYNHFF